MDKYRHELKYIVSQAQIPLLKSRISHVMQLDPHVAASGMYNVRSLYFDDCKNSCYFDIENGTDPREKIRLRIYDHSAKRISLERKQKEKGKTLKTSCIISQEQCVSLLNGEIPDMIGQPFLLLNMLLQMRTKFLRPVTVVEYERSPYVYKDGNVRVTFDTNLSSSDHFKCFFDDVLPERPVMPAGWHLMEVKFDEYLPDFIYSALNLDILRQTSYSKYYLCRKYALRGV